MFSGTNSLQMQQRGQIDDRPDSSTSQRDSPMQMRQANAREEASKFLRRFVHPMGDDDEIRRSLIFVWTLVEDALEKDPKLKRKLADLDEFRDNVRRKGEQDFINSLRDMAEHDSWELLFDDDVFLKRKRAQAAENIDPALMRTTERAWTSSFQGNADLVLFETIADFLSNKRSPYARLTNIVNSSGTGKSRMVDQLGTQIITVPMCLRPEGSQGFPPPDEGLRDWLVSGEPSGAQRRLYEFAYSLLTVTRTRLQTIETEGKDVTPLPDVHVKNMSQNERDGYVASVKDHQESLAFAFRKRMTEGQSFNHSNEYRKKFYDDVIDLAEELIENFESRSALNIFEQRDGVEQAGEKLSRFIDPYRLLGSAEGPRRPLVVFAFDDAHVLTDNLLGDSWNLFLELRRILRQIHKLPIFFLFLSTAGRFNPVSPEIRSDPSNRIRDASNPPLDPISEISFDDLAFRALKNTVILDRVVQIDWISHLGRPLFGSHWDAMEHPNETALLAFAKQNLLDGPTSLSKDNRSGSLACLSVRFALEYNMDGTARDVACAQVEHHMLLCIAATTRPEKMVTLAGSEPLLAEAAYELMKESRMNAVHYLANHSDLNCVDRGRHGELVATLLVVNAYDVARESQGASSFTRRWVTAIAFMKALLPPTEYEALRKSRPTFWRTENEEDQSFEDTFENYGMWINHVIKVEDNNMISVDHLWKFITRGAMVLCTNYQDGVDIILPLCHTEQMLSPDSVTAILIQVKNAEQFKKNIQGTLFDMMDPFDLGIFPEDGPVTPKPVIRLVFALASPETGVVFRERAEPNSYHDAFTSFDIWLAGLSTDTFGKIDEDLAGYHTLLERSLRPHDGFELTGDRSGSEETKKSRGSRIRRVVPLTSSGPEHEAIHRDMQKSGVGS